MCDVFVLVLGGGRVSGVVALLAQNRWRPSLLAPLGRCDGVVDAAEIGSGCPRGMHAWPMTVNCSKSDAKAMYIVYSVQ